MNTIKFACYIKESPIAKEQRFEYTLEKEGDETTLLMDDVEDGGFKILSEKYPEEYYPKAEITRYEVFSKENNEWCPVIGEGDTEEATKEKVKEMEKYGSKAVLALPYARYSLTAWYKLYLKLWHLGYLEMSEDEDGDEVPTMSAETFKQLLEDNNLKIEDIPDESDEDAE